MTDTPERILGCEETPQTYLSGLPKESYFNTLPEGTLIGIVGKSIQINEWGTMITLDGKPFNGLAITALDEVGLPVKAEVYDAYGSYVEYTIIAFEYVLREDDTVAEEIIFRLSEINFYDTEENLDNTHDKTR